MYALQSGGKKMATERKYIPLQKITIKTYYRNTTKRLRIETQYPLYKIPSFKVNLHTNEDRNLSVQYLHSVKHTKFGHEPYIVHYVTNLNNFFESFTSIVYTSFIIL